MDKEKPIEDMLEAIELLQSMKESLEIDLPGDSGYVEAIARVIDFLDSNTFLQIKIGE